MNIYLYHLTQDNIVKYVGLTQQLARTKTRHRKEKPSHQFVIVETYHNREEAGLAEQYHIAAHKTFKGPGWNKTEGGDNYLDWIFIDRTGKNNGMYGKKHTPEARVKFTGENNGNWKGGISLDKKEYDRIRRQRPEVILKNRITQRKFYEKNRDEILARRQTPEVRLRNNRNKRIRYARNKEIQY